MDGAPLALFASIILAPVLGGAYSCPATHIGFYGNWRAKFFFKAATDVCAAESRKRASGAVGFIDWLDLLFMNDPAWQ